MTNTLEKIKILVEEFFSANNSSNKERLSNIFRDLIIQRNNLATEKGYSNYLEMQRESLHKIPKNEYQNYLNKKSEFANKFKPSSDTAELPVHFLSLLPQQSLGFPVEVYKLFKQYPELSNLQNKIKLVEGKDTASFKYHSDTSSYTVNIPPTNYNQKIAMLIHELSHIVCQEKSNHQISSLYQSEKGALEIELQIAKKISTDYYLADIREYLNCLVRTEFEQSIYQNPSQNFGEIYHSCLQKYLGEINENLKDSYLNDNKLIMSPLCDLSTAVALVNLL